MADRQQKRPRERAQLLQYDQEFKFANAAQDWPRVMDVCRRARGLAGVEAAYWAEQERLWNQRAAGFAAVHDDK